VVKLQSLLELALNTDAHGDDILFREDIKITLADTGLYEFLMKVVSVTGGAPGGEDAGDGEVNGARGHHAHGHGHGHGHDEHKKEKEDKKTLTGGFTRLSTITRHILTSHSAVDSLTLDYNVRFPLSLVISRKTVLRYQLLFRFLLHLKHVEQSLSTMWIEQKTGPWRKRVPENDELERWRLRVCLLRARMLSFVQQILAFATFEVLEPNWRALENKLEKVTTVDQLLRDHVDFLDTCLKECMLTSSRLLKVCLCVNFRLTAWLIITLQAYSRLIVTCSTFALYTSSFTKSAHQAMAALNEDDRTMAKRWDFLHKFETNFSHWCVSFPCLVERTGLIRDRRFQVHLNCVQYYASSENVSLLPLVVRLNSVKMGT